MQSLWTMTKSHLVSHDNLFFFFNDTATTEIYTLSLHDALPILAKTGSSVPGTGGGTTHTDGAHPVACVDCHDPKTMELRVTRPGFLLGIRALAASGEPTPHLPSIERWRQTDRARPYDPNVDASRQEVRSFVCGQ